MRCAPVALLCAVAWSALGAAAEERPRPCVDRQIRLPDVKVPIEIACAFSIDGVVLGAAMRQIAVRGLPEIAHVRIDHALHPFFSPAILLTFVDEKKETTAIRRSARVEIAREQIEERAGAAACGNTLFVITAVTVPEKIRVHEQTLARWIVEGIDVAAELRGGCDRETARELLAAVLTGRYLASSIFGPDETALAALDGLVDEEACEILPEAIRARARFVAAAIDPEQPWSISQVLPALKRGEVVAPETLARLSSIEFNEDKQTVTIWLRRSMTAWSGLRFKKIQGVWVKSRSSITRRA